MRCAVVTGANKGIGLEICRQLASKGISVVLTARDAKRGREAVENLKSCGFSNVVFHQLDLLNLDSIHSLATFIKNHYGKLDILVNNAGVVGVIVDWESFRFQVNQAEGNTLDLLKSFTRETFEMTEECLKTNYYGTKGVTEALLPCLLLSDSGRIVNLSGSAGKLKSIPSERIRKELNDTDSLTRDRTDELLTEFLQDFKNNSLESKGWPNHVSAYIVSKASVNAYTRILAKEYPKLCVNCVCPGFVKTDINSHMGILTVEEGAKGPVMLALLPEGGPSGQFFDKMEPSNF
ncbi:hypothetical protein ACH5RR_041531 [Cinchona calisaya]|uniref:Short-chain dehydrogenase/reductase n=1 Tax=Cinchona calisaya TaxID=153742 RepID=A0ABD2XZN4_9GENT